MKIEVRIDKLVIDRRPTSAHEAEALQRRIVQAVNQHIAHASPALPRQPGLESGIDAAVHRALSQPGRKP